MPRRTYTLPLGRLNTHDHPAPERTAYRRASNRPMDFDVVCRVWNSRAAMLKTVRMQQQRASKPSDWRPLVKPNI